MFEAGESEFAPVFAGEGQAAGDHFEHDHAEGIDIGGGSDLLAGDLLRGHVRRSAEDFAGLREGQFAAFDGVGKAKIADDDPHGAGARGGRNEHDVVAFKIAMDDAGFVSGGESGNHLADKRKGFGGGELSFLFQELIESLPGEEFHADDKNVRGGISAGFVAEQIIGAADVGVRDALGNDNFLAKTLEGLHVGKQNGANGFEGDFLFELDIESFVDFAHAAAGDEAKDAETFGDGVTGRKCGLRSGRLRRTRRGRRQIVFANAGTRGGWRVESLLAKVVLGRLEGRIVRRHGRGQ